MLIELLIDVAAQIESVAVVDKVAITPGEPAQSDHCSAVYVWGSQIFDSPAGVIGRGDDAGCLYRRAYQINYRIDICLTIPDDGSEASTTQMLADANTIYTLADTVWCHLAHRSADKTLFDAVNLIACEDIVLGALTMGSPSGGRISAAGYIRVTDPCPPEAS